MFYLKITFKDFWKVPNVLSLIRIALIPVFLVLFLNNKNELSTVTLVVSGVTDIVDGYVARHFNQITQLGKMLDPISDKLTQAAVAIALSIKYTQVAPLLAVFVLKELIMLGAGWKLLRHGKVPESSKWWGKLATVVFYVVMIIIVAFGADLSDNVITILVLISASFMIFSFINYVPIFLKINKGEKIESCDTRDKETQ